MSARKLSYLVLLIIISATAVCGYYASRLRFDYNFDNFFQKGDDDLAFYDQYRKQFGNDNDYLLLGIRSEQGVFEAKFLKKVQNLTDYIGALPNVRSVLSPTNVSNPVIESFGVFEVPYVHVNEPERYPQDSLNVYQSPHLVGTLFSANGESVSLLIQTEENLPKEAGDSLAAAIHHKLAELHLPDYHLAGRVVAQSVFIDRMKLELAIFMSASVVLVLIFLYITFRSWWGMVIPLLAVFLAIIWSLGVMGMFNKPIDIMTMLLPTIMFVVGMSDVVHILTRYISEISQGADKFRALRVTLKEVGLATFLTSLTTSIGFLTLLTTEIVPVRNFGFYTAVSVLLAYVLAFTLLPALLVFLKTPRLPEVEKRKVNWPHFMQRLFRFTLRKRYYIAAASVLLVLLSVFSISTIRLDAKLLDDLDEDDPVQQDFRYFEEHFSGVRPFELYLKAADGRTFYDLEVLQEVEEIEHYLLRSYGLHFISSPVTVVKSLNQALNGGDRSAYKLPETETQMNQVQRRLRQFRKREELQRLVSENGTEGRLTGKMSDIGSARATRLNDSLRTYIGQNTDPGLLQARLTGSAMLLDKNNEYLTSNMLQGLLIAFLIIGCIMGIIYRSLPMVFISLIPNLVPLVLIGGFMGLMGINLKVSTSIIFTIAFGIAVDDTIHFLSKLKLELLAGKSLPYAVKSTIVSTGKAIIITSCILVAGFLTLIFSSFEGTFLIGLLISLTLVFAVFADLFLLPLLMLWFYRPKKKQLR